MKNISIVPTVKHPPSIMVRSVISGKGTGRLYIEENRMRQYKTVFETRLISQIGSSNEENLIFIDDAVYLVIKQK